MMDINKLSKFDVTHLNEHTVTINKLYSKCKTTTYEQLDEYERKRMTSHFMDSEVIEYIKEHMCCKSVYTFNKVNVTIYMCDSSEYEYDVEEWIILNIVMTIILTFNVCGKNVEHTELNVIYIDVDISKHLEPECVKTEINSGSTTVATGDITIWRRDELHRTLIHEIIHSLNLDLKGTDISEYFSHQINIPFNFNEAYTEFITIHIYAIWCAFMNDSMVDDELKRLIATSIRQTDVLIKHLNSDSLKCTLQNSNVMSYMYLKTLFVSDRKMYKLMSSLVKQHANNKHTDDKHIIDNIVRLVKLKFEKIVKLIKQRDGTQLPQRANYVFYDVKSLHHQ
jgi:hypothetical protein